MKPKNAMHKKNSICKYTDSGLAEIHQTLQFDDYVLWVMNQMIYSYNYTKSIEFTDNKISLYSAQCRKCEILGTILDIDDIH